MISALPHPSSLPRTSAKTSMNSAPEKDTNPIQSTRRLWMSLDSCTRASVISDGDHADGDVDEEDPPPPDAAGDRTADQRPDGDGASPITAP